SELRDVVLAIVRDRPLEPVARITTSRTVDHLYSADGTALAEFADDQVIAWADGDDTEQHWREWELELSEDALATGVADEHLLDRLTNRLLDAGARRAGHGSKLARVLANSTDADATPTLADPGAPPAAGEIDTLLAWERAVRADVYDSVHQMRVTTRKIRSLLQASESAFGLSDDA